MTQQDDRSNAAADTVDLTNCDREPIHILGHVQGYGCLISTSSDLMVNHLSEDCFELLGIKPESTIGQKLTEVLKPQTVHDLVSKLQVSSVGAGIGRLFGYEVFGDGRLFDISVHRSGNSFVFEFEPRRGEKWNDDLEVVQPMIARVKKRDTVAEAADTAAMALKALSGFDRVMVYQFAADGSGEVIAEKLETGMEPFLNLRYPASDIPKQARELYKRSTLRLIADVDGPVSRLVPQQNPIGEPLDLSLSVTRAVSPIHLEYLRNMGVAASMSVSILKDGELWGMFACHHQTPRYVDYARRTAIELFAQFFSYELTRKVEAHIREEELQARELHDRLMMRLSSGGSLIENFDVAAEDLSHIVPNDGIAIYSEGVYATSGSVVTEDEFKPLARFLNTAPTGQVFSTDRLVEIYPAAEGFVDRVVGIVAVPISRTPRDYIVFFRREIARSVRWAGNPQKPVEVGPNGTRLTPRKSFAAWTEMVRNTSAPWLERELRAAESLRVSLIEIVLKLTDEANADRQKAAQKQELLIAELNHRVRNILNLIQGLISQSKQGAPTVEAYTRVLDSRVQSLARAHDQLTRQEWSPAALRDLVNVEVDAFLNGQKDRLVVSGAAPLLEPSAFSTMALVIHELVTNSAKYGAFTDRSGKVFVDLSMNNDGDLRIEWREKGGPPVQPPMRKGFGTTVIEKTVPFELKGTVETRYKLTGFEADIVLPGKYVSQGVPSELSAVAELDVDTIDDRTVDLSGVGKTLVLEDNLVIALDAVEMLSEMGIENVQLASSIVEAQAVLKRDDFGLALIDVHLGDETSLTVAQTLSERGVPFVLATGYGDVQAIISEFPSAPIVQKPFIVDNVRKALVQAVHDKGSSR
jgi:light-regulated signal transduction histidine kinase (bacteriophytochrome)